MNKLQTIRPPDQDQAPQTDRFADDVARADAGALPETRMTSIRPPSLIAVPDLREVWRYRDLLLLLAQRNVAAMYRMSVLGLGWSLLRPLLMTLIFTFVFGYIAGLAGTTHGVPYPVFALAGLVSWTYFATSLSNATSSVINAQDMLTKVYFPRLILPLASLSVAIVEVAIQSLLLLGMMLLYGIVPGPQVVMLPFFLLLATIVALGGGIWLTALNVRYRDVHFLVPFGLQILMYLSPVIYTTDRVPERYHVFYYLNPMAGVVEGFRWSLLGGQPPNWGMLALSVGATLIALVSGLFYFARTEQTFADII